MPTPEFEVLTKLNNFFHTSLNHTTTKTWLVNAQKDFEFREGLQWTSTEKIELKDRGQPDIVENEILPIINRLIGQYKQMKTKIVFRGRNMMQDEPTANLLSDLMLYVQQNAAYEYEEEATFDDGVTSGLGVLEIKVEFDDMMQPSIVIKAEDCLGVFPDPYSKRYDWSDANWVCRTKWVTPSDAKSLYPNKNFNHLIGNSISLAQLLGIESLKNENYVDDQNNRIRLIEVWYKEKENKVIAIGGQEGVIDVTTWSKKKRKELKDFGYEIVEKLVPKIKMGVFCADMLCEFQDSPYDHKYFPFVPYYVYRKKSGEAYSIVRSLIDPQTEINKRRSKALHFLNTNQLVIQEGAVRDEEETRKEASKPDGLIKVRNIEQIKIEKNLELAASQFQMLGESKDALRRISGIPAEMETGQLRSGLGVARKQAYQDMVITPIFDNLRRTRLQVGKICLELIKQYFTDENIYYITDSDNENKPIHWQKNIIDSVKSGVYDIIVEEAPATATVQQEEFNAMAEMLKSFNLPPDISMAILPLMLQLSSMKNKDKILAKLDQMSKPSPLQPKMSLNLTWDNLDPMERSSFAQMMGLPDLAQYEQQAGKDPSYIVRAKTDLGREQIKAESQKEQSQQGPMMQRMEMEAKGQEMQMKGQEHQQDMQMKEREHQQKMEHKERESSQKMQHEGEKLEFNIVSQAIQQKQKAKEQQNVKRNSPKS